jgi:hypothetical protein
VATGTAEYQQQTRRRASDKPPARGAVTSYSRDVSPLQMQGHALIWDNLGFNQRPDMTALFFGKHATFAT